MTITIPTISALPTAPSRTDPSTFASRGDAFVAALATLRSEINTTTAAIKTQVEAEVAEVVASNSGPLVGDWVLLREVAISGSPTAIDFVHGTSGVVLSSTYEVYEFQLYQVNPSTTSGGSTLLMRTSTNAGSSYDSAASDYAYALQFFNPSSGVAGYNSSGTTSIPISYTNVNTGALGVSGSVFLHAPSSVGMARVVFDTTMWAGIPCGVAGMGYRAASADVDAVRFLWSGGQAFANSGSIRLWGKKKS